MKKIAVILLFALPVLVQAQNIEYSIYAPAKDSFFLVETITGAASRDAPKPTETKTSQLFRSEAQLLDYVKYLRNQANVAKEQAKKVIADAEVQSKKLLEAAPRIENAAAKIEAVAVANQDVLRGKKPAVQPAPTKPKKTKKKKA